MLSQECLQELRSAWLPNITDAGLGRLIKMLEKWGRVVNIPYPYNV